MESMGNGISNTTELEASESRVDMMLQLQHKKLDRGLFQLMYCAPTQYGFQFQGQNKEKVGVRSGVEV